MIIDKKRKVIYLHNPKCGGTFLRELYVEKYGDSEATKWWKPYTRRFGTDLGHIIYSDLSHFIPEWKEYRVIVMIRNPYNRFYSAFKEYQMQYRGISFGLGLKFSLPIYIYDGIYDLNIIEKMYEMLRIYTDIYPPIIYEMEERDEFCKRICLLNKTEQDFYIRNKKIPWLNPQSFYIGTNVEILRYESEDDWIKLLEMFELSEYQNRISIVKDYNIPDNICAIIKDLYPEDLKLFEMYRSKTE